MLDDSMRDKSYELLPLGEDVAAYLRAKRKRLTESSYRSYEGTLDKLARDFAALRVEDFEPPAGTARLEQFLDDRWGSGRRGRTTCAWRMSRTFSSIGNARAVCMGTPR